MTETLARFEELKVGLNSVFVKQKLAAAQMDRGDLTSVKQVLAEVLAESRKTGKPAEEAQTLLTMCRLSIYEDDFTQAIKHLDASKAIDLRLSRELRVAYCDYMMAIISLQQNDPETADALLKNVTPKIVVLLPDDEAMLLFVRSRAQAMAGNLAEAQKTFEQANQSVADSVTEDLSIQLIRQFERALSLDALGLREDAIHELQSVVSNADKQGWLSLKWEAAVVHAELRNATNEKLPEPELSGLHQLLIKNGFVAFAKRIDAISQQ